VAKLEPGVIVGDRYRIERLLGEGGMGSVWAAAHTITRKRVAVKFLKPELAARPAMVRRFLREARAATAISHPNVVAVHDAIDAGDGPFMVMELLAGETLASRLDRSGRIDVVELAAIMSPVVSAVGSAHAMGIVHRDLKPENLFILRDAPPSSAVKVLDFGIAKLTAPDGEAARTGPLTNTGAVLGTLYYMSPEQTFGERDVDHRADIWSLGVVFFECLSGERPFLGENAGQVLKAVLSAPVPPLREIARTLPADVGDLVARMLERDRTRRLDDLREVASVLARYSNIEVPGFDAPLARASGRSVEPLALRETGDTNPFADTGRAESHAAYGSSTTGAGGVTRLAVDGAAVPAGAKHKSRKLVVAVLAASALVLAVVGVRGFAVATHEPSAEPVVAADSAPAALASPATAAEMPLVPDASSADAAGVASASRATPGERKQVSARRSAARADAAAPSSPSPQPSASTGPRLIKEIPF
jgi:eukaryotic-like serine/threonine-protein kinase